MAPPRDIELSTLKTKEESLAHGSSYSTREPEYEDDEYIPSRLSRILDSFRRDPATFFPNDHLGHLESGNGHDANGRDDDGNHYYDLRQATIDNANSTLARKLKGRHLQMIAIGGSIGTGLFVASGKALAAGGPASLLLAFSIVGGMLYTTCQALGELAVLFPIAGSFSSWATRFLDPSWGFAMGWNYAMQWLIILPLEIIAASVTIGYWDESLTRAIFVTVFLLVILAINMFGIKGYGEAEFIFSIIKVVAVISFILLGIVLNCGGTPDGGYIGGKYWQNPGAFNNGFKGLCTVFVTAAFSFTGTELVGLAAAETANPRKSLPTAIKQVFWRITIFYVVALTLVGLLVPHNNPRLVGTRESADANASPFVIAIEEAGIQVLPSVMNAVILIAVLSVGNSAVFGSSRTLAALANLNQAPRALGYIDRRGRPLMAIGLVAVVGLISYLADLPAQSEVLDWLLAISGLSSIFTWGSICLCHIRFRRAWAARGHKPDELPFRSPAGVGGSYLGLVMNILVLVAQFWVGADPIRGIDDRTGLPVDLNSADVARSFFLKWMGAPIIFAFYVAHKLFYRTSYVRIADMDIDTGRRYFNVAVLRAHERREQANWPGWKRWYKFMC